MTSKAYLELEKLHAGSYPGHHLEVLREQPARLRLMAPRLFQGQCPYRHRLSQI